MLELQNVTAGYGRKSVLNGVTASFEKGKLTSIIGVNGCGKSTLLKTATGILPLSGGDVLMDGVRLCSMSRNEVAKKAAYLPQGQSIPDMTVEQMVLHGRFPYLSYPRRYTEADREIARGAMEAVGVSHLADKRLCELSGGMRQNAYIAMALTQDTDYILLDEPTTYLDVAHQLGLMKLLCRLADAGKGIVTVMHDLPLALNFSDTIVALRSGTVAAQATPSEIVASSLTKALFGVEVEHAADRTHSFYYNY